MSVKILTEHHLEFLSLKGGCRDSSGSTRVKMPHCWKSHALAHLGLIKTRIVNLLTVDGWVHTVRAMEIIGILLIAFASACGALKYFIVKDNDKIVQIAGASAFAAGKFMNLKV